MSKRKFTPVSPAIWHSKRFRELDSDGRLLMHYYLTCKHQNSSGCFQLPDGYACDDLGWDRDRYLEARDCLLEVGLILFDQETSEVYPDGWFRFCAPANKSHSMAIQNMIAAIESPRLREHVEADFASVARGSEELATEIPVSHPQAKPHGNVEHLTDTPFIRRGLR